MAGEDLKVITEQILKQPENERKALRSLLDKYMELKTGYFIAQRGIMGMGGPEDKLVGAPSFTVVHDLVWIGDKIKMGSEMSLMKEAMDEESGRLSPDALKAGEVTQRAPKFTRQVTLTGYLVQDKHRKFPSITVVIAPDWINDNESPHWDSEKRALKDAYEFEALDSLGRLGLLRLVKKGVDLYALDGQHRLMGIRGVQELQEGGLWEKNDVGKQLQGKNKERLTTQYFGIDSKRTSEVMRDDITVEYISGIMKGEKRIEAAQRIRRIFFSVNAYAVDPDGGEKAALDDLNPFRKLAQWAATSFSLFEDEKVTGKKVILRVNRKNRNLSASQSFYTTQISLVEQSRNYLKQVDPDLVESWPAPNTQLNVKLDEAAYKNGEKQFHEYLDNFADLPVFRKLKRGGNIQQVRRFPSDVKDKTDKVQQSQSQGHLLLRPVGQEILATAVGKLAKPKPGGKGMTLKSIFAKLSKLDNEGGFSAHKPTSVFYSVTYNPDKKGMIVAAKNRELATDLLVYLVSGIEEEEKRQALATRAIEARYIDQEEGTWLDFDGKRQTVKGEDISGDELPEKIK